MDFDATVSHATSGLPEIAGIACIDLENGVVVSASVRDERVHEGLEVAAGRASELQATPQSLPDETFVIGDEWIHVLVRAPFRPELVVVGVAAACVDLDLLMSCTRDVARSLPHDARR